MDIKIKKIMKGTGRWRRAAAAGALACAMCISSICAQGAENPADMRVTEGQDESNAGTENPAEPAGDKEVLDQLFTYEFIDPDEYDGTRDERYEGVYIQDGVIYLYIPATDSFDAISLDRHHGYDPDVKIDSYVLGKPVTMIGGVLADDEEAVLGYRSLTLPSTIKGDIAMHAVGADYLKLPEKFDGNVVIDHCGFAEIDLPWHTSGSWSIVGTGVEKVSFPRKVKTITSFQDCKSLTIMFLPSSVTKINAGAFKGCTKLNLFVPDSVKKIGKGAFGTDPSNRIEMLYCKNGSKAMQYAKKNRIPYKVVGSEEEVGRVTRVDVPKKKITISRDGKAADIGATTVPSYLAGQLLYTSSNPDGVYVSPRGEVYAKKAGTSAKITIRAGRIEKTVKVVVRKAKKAYPFTLTLNGVDITFELLNNIPYTMLKEVLDNRVARYRVEYCELNAPERQDYKVLAETEENFAEIEDAKPGRYYIVPLDKEGYPIERTAVKYIYNPEHLAD